MSGEPGHSFRLSSTERRERFQALREATARQAPPVITEAGLRLIRDLAASPQRQGSAGERLSPELERLAQAGIADGNGRLRLDGQLLLETMRRSNVQVQIEVCAGQSVRTWTGWLGQEQAIVMAQSSPAITAGDTRHDVAGREPLTLGEYTLQVVTPGWVPAEALRWLGFGPRADPRSRCQLPLPALLRRVTDPDSPPPRDDPGITQFWDQPLQLCAVTAEPAGERVLLLDSARTGVWLLATGDEGGDGAARAGDAGPVTLTPLPPRAFWRLFLTLTVHAVSSRRARPPGPSSAIPVPGGSSQS